MSLIEQKPPPSKLVTPLKETYFDWSFSSTSMVKFERDLPPMTISSKIFQSSYLSIVMKVALSGTTPFCTLSSEPMIFSGIQPYTQDGSLLKTRFLKTSSWFKAKIRMDTSLDSSYIKRPKAATINNGTTAISTNPKNSIPHIAGSALRIPKRSRPASTGAWRYSLPLVIGIKVKPLST